MRIIDPCNSIYNNFRHANINQYVLQSKIADNYSERLFFDNLIRS